MILPLETERMWARPVRLEDAEQVQKIFPQWEIVKHLGAVVPWPQGHQCSRQTSAEFGGQLGAKTSAFWASNPGSSGRQRQQTQQDFW